MSLLQQERSTGECSPAEDYLVICLCAEWCGTCRDYRPGFEGLARQFPGARFLYLDIEDHADEMGDLDVENFPTLLIKRQDLVLFYGTMLPHLNYLQRMIETFLEQTREQSQDYAFSNPERSGWQESQDLIGLGRS